MTHKPQTPDLTITQESVDISSFMERMQPVLDTALERLSSAQFRADPIGGVKYSRATSIISSAYKRHGQILGRSILERLKDCHRFQVWTEDRFKLSHAAALEIQKSLPVSAYREIELPYGDEQSAIPVDLIVYDRSMKTLCSYNVKRGNGAYDAGKRRLIQNELLRVQMLLSGYGEAFDLEITNANAYVIFYYGMRSIPEPYSLVDAELDDHFQFPVVEAVEAVNAKLRQGIYEMIEGEPSDGPAT